MTISEVSKKYDISTDTLRYYERVGMIPPVKRTAGGIRDYDEESFRWIEFAKCMRSAGLPIEALVEYVALFRQGESTFDARRALPHARVLLALVVGAAAGAVVVDHAPRWSPVLLVVPMAVISLLGRRLQTRDR